MKGTLQGHLKFEWKVGQYEKTNRYGYVFPLLIEVECDYWCETYKDRNYGADADGHRGIPMTCVEDERITNLRLDGKAFEFSDGQWYDTLTEQCFERINKGGGI